VQEVWQRPPGAESAEPVEEASVLAGEESALVEASAFEEAFGSEPVEPASAEASESEPV